jgi:hypothetical protein
MLRTGQFMKFTPGREGKHRHVLDQMARVQALSRNLTAR